MLAAFGSGSLQFSIWGSILYQRYGEVESLKPEICEKLFCIGLMKTSALSKLTQVEKKKWKSKVVAQEQPKTQ